MREEVELKYVLHAGATGLSNGLALGVERVGGSKDVCQVSGLSNLTDRDTVHSHEKKRKRSCAEWLSGSPFRSLRFAVHCETSREGQ